MFWSSLVGKTDSRTLKQRKFKQLWNKKIHQKYIKFIKIEFLLVTLTCKKWTFSFDSSLVTMIWNLSGATSFWESLLNSKNVYFVHIHTWALHEPFLLMMKKVYFQSFSSAFYHFQPCERMRKHAFAGQNSQHLYLTYSAPALFRECQFPYLAFPLTQKMIVYCDSTNLESHKISHTILFYQHFAVCSTTV